jgi:hypothetical protein
MGTINQNQFTQGVLVGQVDLKSGGLDATFTVRIDPDSSASDIEAGTGLQLVDGGTNDRNGVPLVNVLTADTQVPFGARTYDAKQGKVQPGDICQVSYKGVVQWMNSAAALNRGVAVSLVAATPGNVAAVGTNAQFGITLDKATAADQLIRVLVDTAAPTI